MHFNSKEYENLQKHGFIRTSGDIVKRNYLLNGTETIIKNDHDSFDYYFDFNGSDIDKANKNITKIDLSWFDLKEFL